MTNLIEAMERAIGNFNLDDMSPGYSEDVVKAARAALAAIEAAGYRVVPVEPTEEMVRSSTILAPTWDDATSCAKWAAMLAAAPKVTE